MKGYSTACFGSMVYAIIYRSADSLHYSAHLVNSSKSPPASSSLCSHSDTWEDSGPPHPAWERLLKVKYLRGSILRYHKTDTPSSDPHLQSGRLGHSLVLSHSVYLPVLITSHTAAFSSCPLARRGGWGLLSAEESRMTGSSEASVRVLHRQLVLQLWI